MTNPSSRISSPTTLLIILGASEWPQFEDFVPSTAFSQSAQDIKNYFRDRFGLPDENLLDLFDSEMDAIDIEKAISSFISSRKESGQKNNIKIENLIFYFVGHGGFDASYGDAYYLAVRTITKNRESQSALPIKNLAETLAKRAGDIRRYIILDSCFSAAAFKELQSGPLTAAKLQWMEAFAPPLVGPHIGIGLLCSSPPNRPSKSPEGEKYTMFSGAFLKALEEGSGQLGDFLSLRDITSITREVLQKNYGDKAVLPEIHDPGQVEGQITTIPLFPNPAKRKTDGQAIHSIKDIDFSDGNIHAVVFSSEGEKVKSSGPKRMPLHLVAKDALQRYSQQLIGTKTNLEIRMETVNIDHLLTSLENYRMILKYLCQSDIAIFDVTDFEPVAMFLLGIRSAVRRGLTLISVGADYKLGDFIELPFNIKEVNLVSHSVAQARERHLDDPTDLVGKKIVEGLKELENYSDYLDLPTYDAVRNYPHLGGSDLQKRILVLCPFNQEYQDVNWSQYVERNITTVIQGKTGNPPTIVRTLDMRSPRLVSQTLYEAIRHTPMCIVDMSYWRPNVLFELGVRLAVSESDPIPIIQSIYSQEKMGPSEYFQYKCLLDAFAPIHYECEYVPTTAYEDIYQRYNYMRSILEESSLEENSSGGIFGFIPPGFTYNEITKLIDWRKEISAIEVYRDLAASADLISSNREKGYSPALYSENEHLREKANQNALELRLAAWFYIDNRYSPEIIQASPQLMEYYQSLGNIIARTLISSSNPEDKELAKKIRSRSNFKHTEKLP